MPTDRRSRERVTSDLECRSIREGQLVGDVLQSIDWAIRCTVLRDHGHEVVERIEARMLESHQKHYFIRGLQKLGLDHEKSDAIRCAKYHCMSNALGGLRTAYAVETEKKAWIFYLTPFYFDSPWTAGVGVAAFRPQFMIGSMRAWHANNGTLLGNTKLGFAITDLVMRGDVYDAGYFFEADEGSQPLRLAFGEEPPSGLVMESAEFGSEWPLSRQVHTWRNFGHGYVGGRFPWLVDGLGIEGAARAVEHGFRIGLLQRREAMLRDLDVGGGVNEGLRLFEAFHRASGSEVRKRVELGWAEIAIRRSRLHEGAQFVGAAVPMEIERAIEKAWIAMLSAVDASIEVSVHDSQGRGGRDWVWRFERR